MLDTPTPSVPDAFAILAKALAAEVMTNPDEIDRAAAFLKAVRLLNTRWQAGDPPHTVRGPAKKPAEATPQPARQPTDAMQASENLPMAEV